MNIERYTERLKNTIKSAYNIALDNSNQFITVFHIYSAMLNEENSIIEAILSSTGGDVANIKKEVSEKIKLLPKVGNNTGLQPQFDLNLARVFILSEKISERKKDKFITQEIFLIATVENNGDMAGILKNNGIHQMQLNTVIDKMRGGQTANTDTAEENLGALERYTKNITNLALKGKIDPIVGRDDEVRRTIQILSRRTKNNPILIGEPGVGKTAVVEGLAQRIANKDIPEVLKDKIILSLDMAAVIAGAKYQGEFEERLKTIIDDIEKQNDRIILFIDEIHVIVGAGRSDGTSAMDAANLLKPALARGDLHCIGATTLDEYKQYIEKDQALVRRFQPIYVNEPNIINTVSILRGIKEKYEIYHKVKIRDDAIIAAATLSNRYITDRYLPDKAIDLIDEASSRVRMDLDNKPTDLDEVDRRILQFKIEIEALKNETDQASQVRLKKLMDDLGILETFSIKKTQEWMKAKEQSEKLNSVKNKIDDARFQIELARRKGDLSKVAEITYGVIPSLENELSSMEEQGILSTQEVKREDIARVLSKITGIPVDKMLESEKKKLLNMEEFLQKRVIGQENAVNVVANSVRRNRAGLQDGNRPIGSFLFLGPTGVGKTELAKALAEFMFDEEKSLLRVDMSEYMEKHSVSRLIGSPPGYIDSERGGILTNAVRRRPYQVILFDEVEKAHPDVFNLLLQVLDDGRLTDAYGKVVNFTNTIIILTSNLGSKYISELNEDDNVEKVYNLVMEEVKCVFKPEFINRLDETILFHKLTKANISGITKLLLGLLEKRLAEKKFKVEWDSGLYDFLAEKGYDVIYGARPLRRVIQREVENKLAVDIIAGRLHTESPILVGVENDAVIIGQLPKPKRIEQSVVKIKQTTENDGEKSENSINNNVSAQQTEPSVANSDNKTYVSTKKIKRNNNSMIVDESEIDDPNDLVREDIKN
jgi:ATP-dependent Clp protease ATP-binding subunit ClpB